MRNRSSHKFMWLKLGALLTPVALAMLWVATPRSMAQQDNRQLKREQTQGNGMGQRRIALVIGNGAYQTVKPLKNPPNDATLLAATLKKLGFEVTVGTDKSQREMKQLIREFGQNLRGGGGVGLFYFAGHGVQARGHNYLIPVDANIQTEADLEDVAVDVNYVLNMMDDAQNALNIAILDACRNNPFARSFRSAQEGLAQVKAPTGTLIAYATSPDSVAADGGGANSPYAEELTKQIQTPGVLLETMFRRVTEQVSSRSGGRQEPWYSANVKGDFYFSNSPTNSSLSNNGRPTQPATIDAVDVEREYWETIRSSNDPQDYKDYLQTYPNGAFAVVARAKIRQFEAAKNTQPSNEGESNSYSGPLKELLGFYEQEQTKIVAEIALRDGRPTLIVPGQPPYPLEEKEKDKLRARSLGDAYLFNVQRDREGRVSGLLIDQPQGQAIFRRLPNSPAKGSETGKATLGSATTKSFKNQLGIEMVYVPPGSFMMGSTNGEADEKPAHQVLINYSFYMGKYEVTQAQWRQVMGYNPSYFKNDNLPAEQLSWYDAQEFVRKLNALHDGYVYRLPSEAEWEYACRAGTPSDYAGDLNSMAWYGENEGAQGTHQVGQKQPNSFGLYDMHGNVYEWCLDTYHENYERAPVDGSAWLSGDENVRIRRGGSWAYKAIFQRAAFRSKLSADNRGGRDQGLRVMAVVRTQ